ncbi:acetaldehyde dehydrogenase [Thermincola ferriacetica]|uniref:Acetaldehyde dehydrogenase (Acetylating) n=2 Tax=Thermincola TaxID=278993 RepID=D5X8U3_THEPJ|nr:MULTISPECIES: acetaldehyde dehydrogenase (acetylating) [Thermincola]ADG80943.1 acetaldehyde dehydrogenase (acetylating) [Thermincola potens JR]KNZ68770.1 acetaldehyde dehydrogenase [Thermincola ferriacetica]
MAFDYDLISIQEARDIARKAKAAQEILAEFSEEKINRIVAAMAEAGKANAEWLAKMAVDETKFGVFEDKVTKNIFASTNVYEYIKDMKTVGVLKEDPDKKIVEIAAPVGVIMGIIPSTNPTSTTIYKALISVKAGNAIVFSPHPNAARCTYAAAQVMHEAAVKAGAPEGIIGCLTKTTMAATQELMRHDDIAMILATGGSAMVKAAYSSGKPAYGVGPGNVPAFIERTADVKQAVADIIRSKTFDNGVICASEQAIIVDEPIKDQVIAELKAQGAYFLNKEEIEAVSRVVMTPRGGMNAAMVGKSAQVIAEKAGIKIPVGTRILIAPLDGYGPDYPLSYEKLTTVLAFYTVKDWHDACLLSIELLKLGGIGHSFVIHTQDEQVAREFIRKPVFRILVNTPSALGGIGYTTGLAPSLTLGCGSWGGSSTSDNVTPLHLINIKRQAYGLRQAAPGTAQLSNAGRFTSEDIADVVKAVLTQLQCKATG